MFRRPSLRIALPLRFDPLRVWFAIENEQAVFGDIGLAGLDGPIAILRRGHAELRILRIQTQRLRETEIRRMNEHHDARGRSIDLAAEMNPLCLGVVACFAVMTFAGEHGDGIDRIPERVPTHAEAAVVVFRQLERLFARAGLRAREIDDVRERAIERLLRHRDLPSLIQHFFIGCMAVIEKHMPAHKTTCGAIPKLLQLLEAHFGGDLAILAHVPEIRMRITKLRLRPANPHTALPRMIRLMIARDQLSARRIDRMQMRPVRKRLRHALRHLARLHLVITDRFPFDGEVDDSARFLGGDLYCK